MNERHDAVLATFAFPLSSLSLLFGGPALRISSFAALVLMLALHMVPGSRAASSIGTWTVGIVIAAVVSIAATFCAESLLGGTAINGTVEAGRWFLGSYGEVKEAPEVLFLAVLAANMIAVCLGPTIPALPYFNSRAQAAKGARATGD